MLTVGYYRNIFRRLFDGLFKRIKWDQSILDFFLVVMVAVGAVGAYVFTPLERFAWYSGLLDGGLLIGSALIVGAFFRIVDSARLGIILSFVFLMLGIWRLFSVAELALDNAQWNDRRCLRIQEAMLNPGAATRTDLPDVFAALGCRPQSGYPVNPAFNPEKPMSPEMAKRYRRFLQEELEKEVRIDAIPAAQANTAPSGERAKPAPAPVAAEEAHPDTSAPAPPTVRRASPRAPRT